FNTNGQDMNACITAITASAVTDLSTTVMNFSELPAMDIVENAGWVIWNASETFLGNDGCTKTFLNPKKIIISLAKQSATILKVIKAIDYAKKIIEITSCLNAIIDPLELDNIIQLYHGNLKEACVKVV